MARYYDIDSLKVNCINVGTVMFPRMEKCILMKDVETVPTADVVEVKHGYWIGFHSTGQYDDWKCSHCGKFEDTRNRDNCGDHCKYCGAKMDLKQGKRNDTK